MTYQILGIQQNCYTKKDSGEYVRAVNLHCVRDCPKGMTDKVRGQLVETVFCSGSLYDICNRLEVGSLVNIDFEIFGKYKTVVDIQPVL